MSLFSRNTNVLAILLGSRCVTSYYKYYLSVLLMTTKVTRNTNMKEWDGQHGFSFGFNSIILYPNGSQRQITVDLSRSII